MVETSPSGFHTARVRSARLAVANITPASGAKAEVIGARASPQIRCWLYVMGPEPGVKLR